jgi:hypothetical protein
MSDTKWYHILLLPVWVAGLAIRFAVYIFDFALGLVCLPFLGIAILIAWLKGSSSPSPSSSPPGTAAATTQLQDHH